MALKLLVIRKDPPSTTDWSADGSFISTGLLLTATLKSQGCLANPKSCFVTQLTDCLREVKYYVSSLQCTVAVAERNSSNWQL